MANARTKTIPTKNWPDSLTHEVRRIRRWPTIIAGTVSVKHGKSDQVWITFSTKTERLLEGSSTLIDDTEPIILVYPKIDSVGKKAPAVWSGRNNFPRDIGHINPTPDDLPASICLARAGLQPIYDRHGIDGVLNRLVEWMHDAKTGQLMKDGWEPVPIGDGQDLRNGYFDIGYFQDLALKDGDHTGWHCGVARLLKNQIGGGVVFLPPEVDFDDAGKVEGFQKLFRSAPQEGAISNLIPWIFVWSDRRKPIEKPLFGVWNTYGEIENGLEEAGISDLVPTAIIEGRMRLSGQTDLLDNRPIALLVGIWRPEAISEDVYGTALNGDARCLEIRGYLIHSQNQRDNPISHSVEAQQLVSLQLPDRRMLAFISGVSADVPTVVFGYGALGSCIAEFLLRAGVVKLAAFDNDYFAPHNISRHSGTTDDLYAPKVAHLDKLAVRLGEGADRVQVEQADIDVTELTDDQFSALFDDYRTVVDATASEEVRRKLAQVNLPNDCTLLRTELFHEGKLGVLFTCGRNNSPNLVDLYYFLCEKALEEQAIADWLRYESSSGTFGDELIVGFGCASATTKMAKFTIAQHASAFMPKIISTSDSEKGGEPGIGINPLSDDGTPLGWRWFDYGGNANVLVPPEQPEWEVRLSPKAASDLTKYRLDHGCKETGGYLYGGYDYTLRRMFVVSVSGVPPKTVQSSTEIKLGRAGQTQLEQQIARKTAGKLALIGTWHSHPESGTTMSKKDQKTMEGFRTSDRENGVPTLLIISSLEGIGAHLWV